MNARSSRSHTIFIIYLKQKLLDGKTKFSKLNLVDLAGSEKYEKSLAKGQAFEEMKKINKSLSTLGLCIKNLASAKNHVK